MTHEPMNPDSQETPGDTSEAAELFVQRLYGDWTAQDQHLLETRLASDSTFARSYQQVEASWQALDTHADTPEMLAYRAEAIESMRRANARRWFEPETKRWYAQPFKVAAALTGLAVLVSAWQFSPYGYHPGDYRTAVGEQRIIELDDHSHIAIDASTHLRVSYTGDARNVQLLKGQAQFSVAKDPARPFKVTAGNRTVVAVGTVFTVEFVDRKIHVAMMEGKVAVLAPETRNKARTSTAQQSPSSGTSTAQSANATQPADQEIYLAAGQELHVAVDGAAILNDKADIAAATAWRDGKVIFRTTPLADAINRMNRYSRLQIEIDDATLATQHVSGVFEVGDSIGFVNALQHYLPIRVAYPGTDRVKLELNHAPSDLKPATGTQGV